MNLALEDGSSIKEMLEALACQRSWAAYRSATGPNNKPLNCSNNLLQLRFDQQLECILHQCPSLHWFSETPWYSCHF
jgi:hypothetical protein